MFPVAMPSDVATEGAGHSHAGSPAREPTRRAYRECAKRRRTGLTQGRNVTGHPHVLVEVERSGGTYSEKTAVRDGRMITAQSWKSHPEFYREVLACLDAL